MNHFLRRSPFSPFSIALAVVLSSLICFDAYRLTHWIWVPALVVFPFAVLIYAVCLGWQKLDHEQRVKSPNPARVEISLEEGVFILRTPVALGEDAKEALEWMGTMPQGVKGQLREANRFTQMMRE